MYFFLKSSNASYPQVHHSPSGLFCWGRSHGGRATVYTVRPGQCSGKFLTRWCGKCWMSNIALPFIGNKLLCQRIICCLFSFLCRLLLYQKQQNGKKYPLQNHTFTYVFAHFESLPNKPQGTDCCHFGFFKLSEVLLDTVKLFSPSPVCSLNF